QQARLRTPGRIGLDLLTGPYGSGVGMNGLGLGSRHIPMQIHEPSQPAGGGPGRISTHPVPSFSSVIIQVGTAPSQWVAPTSDDDWSPRYRSVPTTTRIARAPRPSAFVIGIRGFTRRV